MKSIYGITKLQVKTFYGEISEVEDDLNAFLEGYDGNIVDVTITGGELRLLKAVVLYRAAE